MKKLFRTEGFTLVEVALSTAILGIILAFSISLYSRATEQAKVQTTYDRMDAIVQALSVYVETADRIPCPADPAVNTSMFGWERGVTAASVQVGAGRFPTGACDATNRAGIVPFLTLGLSDQTARDGWGNYFTYAVSPVFSRSNDQTGTAADTGKIHGRCRHAGWASRFDSFNRNAVKARFCCADQLAPTYDVNTDLVIRATAGGTVISPQRTAGTTANYDLIYVTTTKKAGTDIYPVIDTTPIEAPAFVLVSHGKNGLGAYLGNGTAAKYSAPVTANEIENANGDGVFVDSTPSSAPASYYDDIVRWMTQDGIIAAHGALSCQYP